MEPILVLGLGNRLMWDDGVGVAVVEALAQLPVGQVRCEVGETDFAYCLNLALQAHYLILVDAVQSGGSPGDVSVWPLAEVPRRLATAVPGISQHDTHFLDALFQMAPQAKGILVGIEPFQIDYHWGLSPELERQFASLLRAVQGVINLAVRKLTPLIQKAPPPGRILR